MIEPNQALDLYRSSEQLGMVDKLVQMVADRPAPSKTGMVAVVPLVGVIGKGLSSLEKALGGVDLNDFTKAFKAMEADPQVSEIWLYVNSPGGTATGVEEAAELVRNSTKPTATYSDQIMASAGYYIGAAADRVIVAPSAIVGSIGVRLVIAGRCIGRCCTCAKWYSVCHRVRCCECCFNIGVVRRRLHITRATFAARWFASHCLFDLDCWFCIVDFLAAYNGDGSQFRLAHDLVDFCRHEPCGLCSCTLRFGWLVAGGESCKR